MFLHTQRPLSVKEKEFLIRVLARFNLDEYRMNPTHRILIAVSAAILLPLLANIPLKVLAFAHLDGETLRTLKLNAYSLSAAMGAFGALVWLDRKTLRAFNAANARLIWQRREVEALLRKDRADEMEIAAECYSCIEVSDLFKVEPSRTFYLFNADTQLFCMPEWYCRFDPYGAAQLRAFYFNPNTHFKITSIGPYATFEYLGKPIPRVRPIVEVKYSTECSPARRVLPLLGIYKGTLEDLLQNFREVDDGSVSIKAA